ncbi:hypothetical protein MAR_004010, partial [Mya arenaria]
FNEEKVFNKLTHYKRKHQLRFIKDTSSCLKRNICYTCKRWNRAERQERSLAVPLLTLPVEREVLLLDYIVKYSEMKSHWKSLSSDTPTLTILREILITFSGFTPDVGYAQGMNDILARFLFVFDSESWFVSYYWRWTSHSLNIWRTTNWEISFSVIGFKREFSFLDSLRVFEILSSHHLELSSVEAEKVKRKQTMKEFADIGGVTRTTPRETDAEFTFELFMCVAMLQECRPALFKCTDAAMVFQVINNLAINLDVVLEHSERLFFRYCKKSVEDMTERFISNFNTTYIN